MSYAALMQTEDLPAEFRSLRLRFLVNGVSVSERTFYYGDSLGRDVYPPLPEQEGCYARWDTPELKNLRFDTDVRAVYSPCLTSLASEVVREDSRPAFLWEGSFDDDDRFPAALAEVGGENLNQRTPFFRRTLVEQWDMAAPAGKSGARALRYLSPSGQSAGLELWAMQDGMWQRLDTESFGSYLRITLPAGASALAVTDYHSFVWLWALAGAAALALLVLAVLLLRRAHRRRRTRQRAAVRAASEQTDGAAPAAADESVAEEAPAQAKKHKKHRRARWLLLLIPLLLAAGAAAWFGLGLGRGLEAGRLLGSYAAADALSMELDVRATLGEDSYRLNTDLYRMTVDGKRVTAVDRGGLVFWYCDGLVYLDNGRSFSSGTLAPENGALLEDAITLFRETDVTVFHSSGERIYTVTVGGAAAEQLLRRMLPLAEHSFREVSDVRLELVERSGTLYALRITGSGAVSDGQDNLPVTLSASLLLDSGKTPPELPQSVHARLSGDADVEIPGETMLHLLAGWLRLNAAETLNADVELAADCGPLFLDDKLEWSRYYEGGTEINRVRKNGQTFYAAGAEDPEGTLTAKKLMALAYRLCMLGDPEMTEDSSGIGHFRLTMDQDAMAEMFADLLPEGGAADVSLTAGSVEVLQRDRQILAIRLECSGTVQLLAVSAPASLSAQLEFAP